MKIGLLFGPCVKDILLDKVKDKDIGCIFVDGSFSWNSHPDDFQGILQDWLQLKGFNEDIVYDTIDLLQLTGKLVKATNNEKSHFWEYFSKFNQTGYHHWCDIVVSPEFSTPAVKSAWEHYQIVSGLCK